MTRMTRPHCMEFLGRHGIGRVAVTAQAMPAIVPVNYVVTDDAVVFRTSASGLLARGCDGSVVAFQVDDLNPDGSGGASVLVVGQARLLSGRELARAGALDLHSAMGDDRAAYVEVPLTRVSGRWVGGSR